MVCVCDCVCVWGGGGGANPEARNIKQGIGIARKITHSLVFLMLMQ